MADDLEKLLQQKKSLDLKISRARKKTADQKRKDDTRRKILVGAVVMEKMKKDNQLNEQVNKLLADNLVHDRDRVLFGLPILSKTEN